MWFVAIGLGLLGLKFFEVAPVAAWDWWIVLAPFALAALWWHWADSSGHTQRKAMEAMEEKKAQRRQRSMEALGQGEVDKKKSRK